MARMVRFGELTYCEIRQQADGGCLALVPSGCTEQQGPHLPVSFDSSLVETLARAADDDAARSHGTCVRGLPTLAIRPAPPRFARSCAGMPRDLAGALGGHL